MWLALWVASAAATGGLSWQLAEPVRYELSARVFLPAPVWFRAERNAEARAQDVAIHAVVTCAPTATLKSSWDVFCTIDDIAIGAVPLNADIGRLQPILEEWDERLTGAQVEFVLTKTGRVRNLDLTGVPRGNTRTSQIQEDMRLLLRRAFASFDLELPKKGDDRGRGTWRQGASMAMEFASEGGTVGSAALTHKIAGTSEGSIEITTAGGGTLGPGITVATQGNEEKLRDLYKVSLSGRAVFDTGRGLLIEREYLFDGTPTASSIAAESGAGYPYVQAARLALIEGEAPLLGPSGEMAPPE